MFTKMLTDLFTTNNPVKHPTRAAIQGHNPKKANTAEGARETAEDQQVK